MQTSDRKAKVEDESIETSKQLQQNRQQDDDD